MDPHFLTYANSISLQIEQDSLRTRTKRQNSQQQQRQK
jgi:hypothetical protein